MARQCGVTEPAKKRGAQGLVQPVNKAKTKSQSAAAAFFFVDNPLPSVQVRGAINLMTPFKMNKRMHHDL